MKQSAAIAHFRQLCCLGIDAQTAMPSLLQALHGLIGSASSSFYWADHNGDIVNVYFEQLMPKDVAAAFFSRFLNNRACEYSAIGLRKFLPPGSVVANSARVFPKAFYRSELYDVVWRPQRRRELLWARVRDDQGRANGITLMRVVGEPAFTPRDEQVLGQVVPYLAHAINAPAESPAALIEAGESGLVILGAEGGVQHESAEGRRLLLLAAHPRLAPGTVDWRGDAVMSTGLAKLRRNLDALLSGGSASPPALEVHNGWGKFVLRAYPMAADGQIGNRLVAVLIERHVPVQLALTRAMRQSPLSAKQQEVCLLLAEGASYRAIAERLHVRPSTVIDHVRKIYDKLEVRSREALRSKLLHGHRANAGGISYLSA